MVKSLLAASATLAIGLSLPLFSQAHPLERRATDLHFHAPPAASWQPAPGASFSTTPVPENGFQAAAEKWVAKNFAITPENGQMMNGYQDAHTGVYHYYTCQHVDGLMVANAVADVHLDANGNAVTASNGFINPQKLKRRDLAPGPEISASQAVEGYAKQFNLPTSQLTETKNPDGTVTITGASFAESAIKAEVKLYNTGTALEKVWSLSVPRTDAWHNAFVSVKDGTVIGNSNWQSANFWVPPNDKIKRSVNTGSSMNIDSIVSEVSSLHRRQAGGAIPTSKYRVVAFGTSNVEQGTTLLENPFDKEASPLGWHDMGDGNGPLGTTAGNNVIAQENRANRNNPLQNQRPIAPDFNFDFPFDAAQQPPQYGNASITNMFFLSNMFHDTLYKYGFTEQAGNFQVNNNGKGGQAQDPVIANAQDGSGTDNANFATPPDGTVGIMRMFVFTATNPQRDGTLENDIPLHELAHGLSTRLTGGPANSNCLNTLLSGGMGEGWSDFMGVTFGMTAKDTRDTPKPVGTYVLNNQNGVRGLPYSTNTQLNPLTYETLNDRRFQEVHQVGTVWNTMLFEAYWNMVDAKGFEPNVKDGAQSGKGNTLMVQYVVDGMKLQPCNPTIVQARDAILAAETALTKGENQCLLWAGFAKRGLGPAAPPAAPFKNDFNVPPECAGKVPAGGAPPAGGQTGGQQGGQTGGQAGGQTGGQAGGQTGGQTGGQKTGGQAGGQTGGQAGGQKTGGQQTGGQQTGGAQKQPATGGAQQAAAAESDGEGQPNPDDADADAANAANE